jgi:hypothetical protein
MNERFALNTTLAACLLLVCALLHENARNVLADAYAFDEGSGSTTAPIPHLRLTFAGAKSPITIGRGMIGDVGSIPCISARMQLVF